MGGAGIEEHGLARRQRHHVQQQRREQPHIPRVLGGQAGDEREGLFILMRGGIGQQACEGLILAGPFQDQQLVEEVLQARLIPSGVEGRGQLAQGREADACEQRQNGGNGAKTVHRLIGGEGEHQLRLVVRILVVAIARLEGDASGLFLGETDLGLGLARMHLDGERLLGAQHLEQEGQAGDGRRAQGSDRIGIDQGCKRLDTTRQRHFGAAVGVSPHPQFGLWPVIRIRDTEQTVEGVTAAPVVTLNRVMHQQKRGLNMNVHKGYLGCI
ncbi:hypothetical protein D3C79_456830 [compost metagenome]